jgi:hypothetical protein
LLEHVVKTPAPRSSLPEHMGKLPASVASFPAWVGKSPEGAGKNPASVGKLRARWSWRLEHARKLPAYAGTIPERAGSHCLPAMTKRELASWEPRCSSSLAP